jgi:transposase
VGKTGRSYVENRGSIDVNVGLRLFVRRSYRTLWLGPLAPDFSLASFDFSFRYILALRCLITSVAVKAVPEESHDNPFFIYHLEVVMRTVSFIGLGIDTARYGHHVSALDQDKRTAFKAFHFPENAEGYQRLDRALRKLAEKYPGVVLHVRIDAAGQYAENLIHWLHDSDLTLEVSVGQPAKNKAYRKAHFDKRKADPVESLACARFAVVERPPATEPTPSQFSRLRDVVAQLEASAKQRTRLVNQLHGLLARAFPELATIASNISAGWVLSLLLKYPTPQRIAAAKFESLLKIPHMDAGKATLIVKAAKASTASASGETVEKLIKRKVRAIHREDEEAKALQKLTQEVADELPSGPHRRVQSIPGIGVQTAAALVAKIVSIERFKSASALIGYFAVFPEEVDVSGTDKSGVPKRGTETRMSRKGNDLVRRLLYTAAQCAAKHNPPVKALFARQMAAGKNYNVAIGHCMAKLLRQVFGVWTRDRDFDANYETPRQQEPKSAQKKSRGPQDLSGQAAKESGHHDHSHYSDDEKKTSTRSNETPSASPSHRPDTSSAQADVMVRRKGSPHSAEPERRSTPRRKKTRHHARRP